MALKAAAPRLGSVRPHSNVGMLDLGSERHGFVLGIKSSGDFIRPPKWVCLAVVAQKAVIPVDDDEPLNSKAESSEATDKPLDTKSKGFHKDLYNLPKPLSVTDLSSSNPGDDSKLRVAYKGMPGAFSEAAALKVYPACKPVPCNEFEATFKAVELWLVEKAILPIENSVSGSIHQNYDLLLRYKLHIVGEVQMSVNHCLMALPGVRKEELKCVLSHPQAHAQCDSNLIELGVTKVNVDSTAVAAQMVATSSDRDSGAIASARAAKLYGLNILAENIQDNENNVTRFLILSREPVIVSVGRPHKTSIVFALEEGAGVLFKALSAFIFRGINLTKIESRPWNELKNIEDSNKGKSKSTSKCFDYIFYIDFDTSLADIRAQNALSHVQEIASFLRILGSYPMDTGHDIGHC